MCLEQSINPGEFGDLNDQPFLFETNGPSIQIVVAWTRFCVFPTYRHYKLCVPKLLSSRPRKGREPVAGWGIGELKCKNGKIIICSFTNGITFMFKSFGINPRLFFSNSFFFFFFFSFWLLGKNGTNRIFINGDRV